MRLFSPAERVLRELGITEPHEIDLEAIAWHQGVRVKFCRLDGCEARLIGHKDKAIARIGLGRTQERQRFSIAHELGHWSHHRGRILICRPEDIGGLGSRAPREERVADQYAADLLMPRYIFEPLSRQVSRLTVKSIREMASLFGSSYTATAIRLVTFDHSPTMLVCHGANGRKWFNRSQSVPSRWFPRDELDADSFAFGVLYGDSQEDKYPRLIGADAWFNGQEAARYELYEQSVRVGDGQILTLLTFKDGAMLEEVGSYSRWK